MALNDFREIFAESYQDIFQKKLVAMEIANTRFESQLKYGDTVHRFKLDIDAVKVRDVTNLVDQTIDAVTDSDQTLVVDQRKGTAFPIANWEEVQAGPLAPAMTAGNRVATKLSIYVDGAVFAEVLNAGTTFDTGDLTTLASTGVPITLSTSNVPQVLTNLVAKLKSLNVGDGQQVLVLDPYAIAMFAQHAIGKNIEYSGDVLKNGFAGDMFGMKVYVSNNLTSTATLYVPTTIADTETITINGVTFEFMTTLGTTPGQVLIGGAIDTAMANLVLLLNTPVGPTTSNFVALTGANLATIQDLNITATYDSVANIMTLVAKGAGRLILSETLAGSGNVWSSNYVHCYAGSPKAIDIVIQDGVKPILLQEPKQNTKNVITNVLYGLRTFDDGAAKFLDLKISA